MFSDSIWRLLAGSLELSQREFQILQAVIDDQKESAIVANLGISSHTVHTHLERLYHKLGVTSRVTLVTRVFVEYLSRSPVSVGQGCSPPNRRRAPRATRPDVPFSRPLSRVAGLVCSPSRPQRFRPPRPPCGSWRR